MDIQFDRQIITPANGGDVTLIETRTATVPNDGTLEASLAEFFTPEPPAQEAPADPAPDETTG